MTFSLASFRHVTFDAWQINVTYRQTRIIFIDLFSKKLNVNIFNLDYLKSVDSTNNKVPP